MTDTHRRTAHRCADEYASKRTTIRIDAKRKLLTCSRPMVTTLLLLFVRSSSKNSSTLSSLEVP